MTKITLLFTLVEVLYLCVYFELGVSYYGFLKLMIFNAFKRKHIKQSVASSKGAQFLWRGVYVLGIFKFFFKKI